VSATRFVQFGVAIGIVFALAGCGGSAKKVPTSFSAINPVQTRYQMVLETDDGSVIELDNGSLWAVADADQLTVLRHWSLDSNLVEVGKDGRTLINAEAANTNNVRAIRIGTTAGRKAYAHTGDNTLGGIGHGEYFNGTADGSVVTLADGSVWTIPDPNDEAMVVDWAGGDDVVVKKVPGSAAAAAADPSYTLNDTDVESTVTAYYVGGGR
jgi:hypothetical protein